MDFSRFDLLTRRTAVGTSLAASRSAESSTSPLARPHQRPSSAPPLLIGSRGTSGRGEVTLVEDT
jgi:hypothetical protein